MNVKKNVLISGSIIALLLVGIFLFVKIGAGETESPVNVEKTSLGSVQQMNDQMRPIIVFGDELDYPPYSYVDESGEPTGYSVELAKAVAEVMGYQGIVQQKNWNQVLESLDNGEIDVISGMFYSDERALKYDFTAKYAVARGDVFTRKGMNISEISQLEGKTVVVPSGDIVHEYLMGLDMKITLVPVETASQALQAVAAGYYDYAAVLKVPGVYLSKQNKLDNLVANGLQIAPQNYCMAVRKGDDKMLATLNEGFQILKQTGSYQEISERWVGIYERESFSQRMEEYLLALAGVLFIIILLFVWIVTLRFRVKVKTKDLMEAIQFNQEIIQSAQEGIVVYGKDYSYKIWNNYMEKLTGFSSDQVVGQMPNEVFRVLEGTNLYGNIERALQGEKFMGMDYYANLLGKTENAWISQSYGPLKDAKGNIVGVISTIQNITERKNNEEHLKYVSLHDHLTNLYNRSLFEEEMKIFQKSREFPISIISCDLDGLKIVNDTMGHSQGDELLVVCSQLIQESLRVGDILARIGGDEFAAILPNTDSINAEIIVNRIHRNVVKNNKEHLNFPISISIGVATAINSEISLEKVLKNADEKMYREKLIQKKSSHSQIINSLMAALGEKDYITEGHSRRLSYISGKMASELGQDNDVMINLNLLTQVHDLGKVGIPDSILLKPDKLTEEEWVIMRQHPEKGYRIAMASPDLSQIADLILKHHEKWDGTGYPLGIKEKEIPIECRILAIVDAFDAMTNDRPYSKAVTIEAALNEISRCAGTQFDPHLVRVFLKIMKLEGDSIETIDKE